MNAKLANISAGRADVTIDGKIVGRVERRSAARNVMWNDERSGRITNDRGQLAGSQSFSTGESTQMWFAYLGLVRPDQPHEGIYATRAEAVAAVIG